MERLVRAEERAAGAERQAEQLRDQIKTMSFGGMMQEEVRLHTGKGACWRQQRAWSLAQLKADSSCVTGASSSQGGMMPL